MARKKIEFEEKAISEILVTDIDSESGAEAHDIEAYSEGEEEEEEAQQQQQQQQQQQHRHRRRRRRYNNNNKPQQKSNHKLQQVADYQPAVRLKEHKYSSLRRSSKGCEKSEAPHISKDSSPLSVLMLFFTEMFHLLVEQTNVYYQQHLYRQAGPSRQLPDITLPDMATFVALAPQMGHELKDTLHN
jgi:hypothetical protein